MSEATITLEMAASTLRAHLARALAEALITGIDHAQAEGHELTQLQQIDLATMSHMAYGAHVVEGQKGLGMWARLEKSSRRRS